MSPQELADVEDQINAWILENHPVRPITTTLDEARALGAMALFGEKYGEIVRMVEIGDGDFSRELCGGTHVRSTAEIGVVRILGETSSAANVRRIEAISGPAAIASLRSRDRALQGRGERAPQHAGRCAGGAGRRAKPSAASWSGRRGRPCARRRSTWRPLAGSVLHVGDVPFVRARIGAVDPKELPRWRTASTAARAPGR